ncbi:hypothetical protein ACH40F_30140 [Streptomyces sp. NPDC020794]|uniref:hypothetical protein n=1 Tax=unclassified Streptomyces TaxID=2593676 RepID=UPI0036E8F825
MAEREPNAHQFTLDDVLGTGTAEFMDLEIPEYAYMFGFLQADGHLSPQSRQRGRLTVEINVRDIDLLRKFQGLTPYKSSITERTRSTNFAETSHTALWSLYSLEARTKLNQLGLPYGRKSKTITPPRVVFSRRDYLRGFIDADGSVSYTQGYPMYITEAAQNLAAHLYYPGCLSLKRKQTTAEGVAAWTGPAGSKPRPPRIEWTHEMDRILLAAPTIAHAAAELGYSWSACQVRRWKLLHAQ